MEGTPKTLSAWSQEEIDYLLIEPICDMVKIIKQLMVSESLNEILAKAGLSRREFNISSGKLIILSELNTGDGKCDLLP